MQARRTDGAALLTPPVPRVGIIAVILGVGFVLALVPSLLLLLLVERGDPGRARVLSTTEDSAVVQVLDGPRPATWTVRFLDSSDVDPGETVGVRLTGACRCEPRRDLGSPAVPVAAALLLGVAFLFALRMWTTARRVRKAQLRSMAVADRGAPATPVLVRPRFSPGSTRTARLWLEVLDGERGDRSAGWTSAGRVLGSTSSR